MKALKFTILLIVIIVLINWIRQGNFDGHLPAVMPFLGGKEPSVLFDGGSIICIGIVIWGLLRLARNRRDDDD